MIDFKEQPKAFCAALSVAWESGLARGKRYKTALGRSALRDVIRIRLNDAFRYSENQMRTLVRVHRCGHFETWIARTKKW